jgi:hypothetical protein
MNPAATMEATAIQAPLLHTNLDIPMDQATHIQALETTTQAEAQALTAIPALVPATHMVALTAIQAMGMVNHTVALTPATAAHTPIVAHTPATVNHIHMVAHIQATQVLHHHTPIVHLTQARATPTVALHNRVLLAPPAIITLLLMDNEQLEWSIEVINKHPLLINLEFNEN